MHFKTLVALAVAVWPAVSPAQTPDARAAVVEPSASVPEISYRPVLRDIPKGVVNDSLDWVRVNAEVGQFTRGHMDIVRWERAHASDASGPQDTQSSPQVQEPRR